MSDACALILLVVAAVVLLEATGKGGVHVNDPPDTPRPDTRPPSQTERNAGDE